MKDEMFVRKFCFILFLAMSASAFAQNNNAVSWHRIVGLITAPGIDNPVGGFSQNNVTVDQIHSGAGPWTAVGGNVRINLQTGEGSFAVEGLVLNGGNATGTPGAVKSVMGTLVCSAGTPQQMILDTAATDLSSTGDADLTFKLSVPVQCGGPLFLIRTTSGRWIGTAAVRTTRDEQSH